jgi:hypothetical protein
VESTQSTVLERVVCSTVGTNQVGFQPARTVALSRMVAAFAALI